MQRDLPIPNRNLEGLPGLNLEANIDFDFYQAKSISFDAAWKAERDGSWLCLAVILAELCANT